MNSVLIIVLIALIIVLIFGQIFIFISTRSKSDSNQTQTFSGNDKELATKIRKEVEIEYKSLLLDEQTKNQELENKKNEELSEIKESLHKREVSLEQGFASLDEEKNKIREIKEQLRNLKSDLLDKKDELQDQIAESKKQLTSKLESIAQYSKTEAKDFILKKTKEEMGHDLLDWQQKAVHEAKEEANSQAKEMIALALQRCSSEVANEFTLTTIKLKNEELKGKIIGKGGRNIQWLEKQLGVELVIDDTPEVITVSGFSSIRRHIAKRTIELLLEDGRIHPSSIEDMHEKAKAEIAQEIADAGAWAVADLNIYDFPAKLTRLIGRLKFRTSYGQNMLKHSVEMARLAALMANDINAQYPTDKPLVDVDICIKGALLHDIGKGVDEDTTPKTDHITLGERICDSFGLDWRIRKCISSHHDESYYDDERDQYCLEAAIVDACDNLSGGRSGARKETAEAYYQRMSDLEKIANTTTGVTKSWIMRGSRELWVFFDTKEVSPDQMHELTKDIAQKIQTSVNYPGEIKVIGFWEDKIVEYAH